MGYRHWIFQITIITVMNNSCSAWGRRAVSIAISVHLYFASGPGVEIPLHMCLFLISMCTQQQTGLDSKVRGEVCRGKELATQTSIVFAQDGTASTRCFQTLVSILEVNISTG